VVDGESGLLWNFWMRIRNCCVGARPKVRIDLASPFIRTLSGISPCAMRNDDDTDDDVLLLLLVVVDPFALMVEVPDKEEQRGIPATCFCRKTSSPISTSRLLILLFVIP